MCLNWNFKRNNLQLMDKPCNVGLNSTKLSISQALVTYLDKRTKTLFSSTDDNFLEIPIKLYHKTWNRLLTRQMSYLLLSLFSMFVFVFASNQDPGNQRWDIFR